jgi:integrase
MTSNNILVSSVAANETTVSEAVGQYLDAYEGRDPTRVQRLAFWVKAYGDKPLASITIDDVEAGLKTLATQPARVFSGKDVDGNPIFKAKTGKRAPATLNRYLISLAAMFTWARKNRVLPRNHESPTKFVDKYSEGRGRVRFLTEDERAALLEACHDSAWPRLYLLVLMAITTGARRGELLGLQWQDVDLERGEATLHDTKNGDRRVLILIAPVIAELRKYCPKDGLTSKALVFRSRLRPSQAYSTAKAFNIAVEQAGIKNFRFHDCRHCTASYLAQHGASLLEIADTLGHRQLRMVQRYAHLNTDSRKRLMSRVFEGRL